MIGYVIWYFLIFFFSPGFIAAGDESITRKKPSVESWSVSNSFFNKAVKNSQVVPIAEEDVSSELDKPLQRLSVVEDDVSGLDTLTVYLEQRSQSSFSKFFKSFDRKPSRVSPFPCIIEEDEDSPSFLGKDSLSQVEIVCQLIVRNKFDDAYREMTDLSSRGLFDTDALQEVCVALQNSRSNVSPQGHVDFVQREQSKLRFSNSVKPAFEMSQMVCDARELRSMSKSR